jgi:hypothetical protein
VADDLGLLLWFTHGVELANGDGVAQVEQPGRSECMMYVCGIDMQRFYYLLRVTR